MVPSLEGSEVSSSPNNSTEGLDTLTFQNEIDWKKLSGTTKKELSWSDESGQSLVEYVDEVSEAKNCLLESHNAIFCLFCRMGVRNAQ